jgi:hypothetical protein
MTDRNWDAELAKIDRQLASLSDDTLVRDAARGRAPSAPAGPAPAAVRPPPARGGGGTPRWQGWVRTAAAVGAAVGVVFWPWPGTCGAPVLGLVAAAGGVMGIGLWSAVGTWRHRHPVLHVVSLVTVLWGGGLAAREVLPRVGYAIPTAAHPAQWQCEAGAPADAPRAATPAPSAAPPSAPSPAPSPAPAPAPSPGAGPRPAGSAAAWAPRPPLAPVPSLPFPA